MGKIYKGYCACLKSFWPGVIRAAAMTRCGCYCPWLLREFFIIPTGYGAFWLHLS